MKKRDGRRPRAIIEMASEGDYLASVSDLMSGLLFVFMIALMVFVLSLAVQESLKKREVERLQGADQARLELLEALRERLLERGVQVEVDSKQGVLRLKEGILFDSGSAELGEQGAYVVSTLADVLAEVLPCYATGGASPGGEPCPDRADAGLLDALMIEGHTDDRPLSGTNRYMDNWELSTARARSVYLELIRRRGDLDRLENRQAQSVLSVSGYADRRGVVANADEESRRRNRRIDLRFLLSPRREEDLAPIERVARQLEAAGAAR